MSTIVVGHFEHVEQRENALAELARQGFGNEEFGPYYLNPPGQHGLRRFGGDVSSDEGASEAGKGAAAAAAIGGAAGLAIGSVAGPVGALAGAGVGAYVGSLAGALRGTHEPHPEDATVEHPVEPPAGPAIAVCVDRSGSEQSAVAVLRHCNASQIERVSGTWADSECQDCDPRQPTEVLFKREPGTTPPPHIEP